MAMGLSRGYRKTILNPLYQRAAIREAVGRTKEDDGDALVRRKLVEHQKRALCLVLKAGFGTVDRGEFGEERIRIHDAVALPGPAEDERLLGAAPAPELRMALGDFPRDADEVRSRGKIFRSIHAARVRKARVRQAP